MRDPFLLMIAGPNGAGKTTLTNWLRERGVGFGEYINPDDIAGELRVRGSALQTMVAALPSRMTQAQIVADRRRDALSRQSGASASRP